MHVSYSLPTFLSMSRFTMLIANSEPPRLSDSDQSYQVDWSKPYQQKYEPSGNPPGRHARLPEESNRLITSPSSRIEETDRHKLFDENLFGASERGGAQQDRRSNHTEPSTNIKRECHLGTCVPSVETSSGLVKQPHLSSKGFHSTAPDRD